MTVVVSAVSKTYRQVVGAAPAVSELSMTLRRGELVALAGESGSGKTTLLRMLGCQIPPDRGVIEMDGRVLPSPYSRQGAEFRNRCVGFVFQEFGLIEHGTARQNVALPLRYAGLGRRKAESTAEWLLGEIGIARLADTRVSNLSAGQRQRVAVARARAADPEMILADEPTSNLDPENRQLVIESLQALRDAGRIVVVATHDEPMWRACDRVLRISGGRLEQPEGEPASGLDA